MTEERALNTGWCGIILNNQIAQKPQKAITMKENEISSKIIGCAIKVHKALGPGLLESAYQECLFYEIKKCGMSVKKQFPMPLTYEEVQLDFGYRLDLLVEDRVVIEIKSVDA